MSQNNDINNHVIKGRLKDRFNDHAFDAKVDLEHDKALDALEESNINTGLLMGSETHIGRKDQFHFHEEKERFDSKDNQEKRSKKFMERLFIRVYLDQLQQTLDAIDEQINKIKERIEQTQMRLAENMREFGHNENLLNKIDRYMNGEIAKKQAGTNLADDELSQLIILMGYIPSDLNDSEVRKILDEAANNIRKEQEILENKIKDDTNRIDYDTQELEEQQEQRDHIMRAMDTTLKIANDDMLEDIDKERLVKKMAIDEKLTMDEIDQIYNNIDDKSHAEETKVLSSVLDDSRKEEHLLDSDFTSNEISSLKAFMAKP